MRKILWLCLVFFGFISCSDDDNTAGFSKIFIFGHDQVSGTSTPGYWDKQYLWTGFTNTPGEPGGAIVAGDAVLLSVSYDRGGSYAAAVWSNSTLIHLETNGDPSATGMDYAAGTLYVAGAFGSTPRYACYWANGIRTDITTHPASSGSGVFVFSSGGTTNIYIVGSYNDGGWKPCFWKNGVHTELTGSSGVGGMSKSGNELLITGGNGYWSINTGTDAVTWTALSNCTKSSGIRKIDGSIYVAGAYTGPNGWTACYWKDGQQIILETTNFSYAADILPDGKTIYAVGSAKDSTNSSANPRACIWENGSRIFLTQEEFTLANRLIGIP